MHVRLTGAHADAAYLERCQRQEMLHLPKPPAHDLPAACCSSLCYTHPMHRPEAEAPCPEMAAVPTWAACQSQPVGVKWRHSTVISHHPHYSSRYSAIVRWGRFEVGLVLTTDSEYLFFDLTRPFLLVAVVFYAVLQLRQSPSLPSDDLAHDRTARVKCSQCEAARRFPTGLSIL